MQIKHVESSHSFVLRDASGFPESLAFDGGGRQHAVALDVGLRVEVGGREQRSPTGGLDYVDTFTYEKFSVVGAVQKIESAAGLAFHVPFALEMGGESLRGSLVYRLNRFGPAVSFGVHLPGGQPIVVRNIRLTLSLSLGVGDWRVTAPGNCLASGTPIELVSSPIGISGIGGLRGASGLIHLGADSGTAAVALWIDDDTEVPDIEMSGTSKNTMLVATGTNFAADLSGPQSNDVQLFSLDLSVPSWPAFPETFEGWLRSRGLTSPSNPPEWSVGAMIYEAQIGFSVFNEVHRYSPYPEVDDLIRDLNRIQALGFSVIQLMPRQPYPSYNVHDYWDIDTSYGPIQLIRDLITECQYAKHSRDLRCAFAWSP